MRILVVADLAETLNGMLARIERALEENARFVADASHEIRNPLTNLSTEIQVLLRQERPPAETRAALASMRDEVRRLVRLADDLLYLARADAGRPLGARRAADLGAIARATAGRFRTAAAAAGVELEAADGPPSPVEGDPDALDRCVRNLVENAVRYTPRGGRIRVEVAAEDGRAILAVEDSGPGIPKADRLRVLDRFARGEAARIAAPEGSGLGLAVAREIARGHGGDLRIGDACLGGTRAEIPLPLFTEPSS